MLVGYSWIFVDRVVGLADTEIGVGVGNLAVKDSKMKIFPNWYHVYYAGKLEHEQGGCVERVLIRGLEKVDGPDVDVCEFSISIEKLKN